MGRELSLADKCLLLFGAAIVALLTAALATPWVRLRYVIDESLLDTSRQIARLWPGVLETETSLEAFLEPTPAAAVETPPAEGAGGEDAAASVDTTHDRVKPPDQVRIAAVSGSAAAQLAQRTGFAATAARAALRDPKRTEYAEAVWQGQARVHHYARIVRNEEGEIEAIVFVEHRSPRAAALLFVNRVYILAAGLAAGALAVVVFSLILKRIVFSPVRELRLTATRIAQGETAVRADIHTGDEFEDLAEAFNAMLASLEDSQQRLRELNRSLDLRLAEAEQANVALHEAARVKSEFLANISHELRTPLNSIIGFAELLLEIARNDAEREGSRFPALHEKRVRYLENIVVAGRSLLEMINDLLEMAKLEAGRTELRVEPCNIVDACEGLLALLRPQAERKRLTMRLEAPQDADSFSRKPAPVVIRTDARKLQQIIFNFLSNAVKFTPEEGMVTVRIERVVGADACERVRVSVLDTGPGIPPEARERIFQKFTQLESAVHKGTGGTGLGLAIAAELASLIGADIQVESELGEGSMFSVIVPVDLVVPPAASTSTGSDATAQRSDGALRTAVHLGAQSTSQRS